MNDIEPVRALDHITDRDILSYFQARDTSCFITYDLGKTTTIEKSFSHHETMTIMSGREMNTSSSIKTE